MQRLLIETPELLWLKNCLVEVAQLSTCRRSKCGSIIVYGDQTIIGEGYNSKPCNISGDCLKDDLPIWFKSDKTCCVHAEQRAIMDALSRFPRLVPQSTLYFIRLDDNDQPKHSGDPYCTICSKMALDVGILEFVLWRKEGWVAYEPNHYNELSFAYGKV